MLIEIAYLSGARSSCHDAGTAYAIAMLDDATTPCRLDICHLRERYGGEDGHETRDAYVLEVFYGLLAVARIFYHHGNLVISLPHLGYRYATRITQGEVERQE